jgi:hypothetical protein
VFNSLPTPGSIGPDGNCVSCGKHVQTTGGCMDCQRRLGQYITAPSITVTPSVVIVNPSVSVPVAMCPHMRPDWRQCPHCLGINVGEP